ncbi:DNA methyltransferase [Elizabethkingia anophelis]|uniref:DNA methyltransferase n=1 Tax=Elizabethkingia anophelis TaxID=1117645 RepID=UPI0016831690|nr:DNA methyltransferase [Elizabethkingia anophelis]QNV11270.1 DNA methylase N-4 [Elizabethkingia anophelis]UTG04029.1 DNA methylase N-4 [Elizabethkingia anophelis]UTG07772.1 DNA methylase N-4 [Elizabethkingia anophelis]UTG11514.1 DNA methylase N-4 [Elizabethkingia anophelis]UTG18957.1 DNA methylase N-4 [Elizabethkingia anophelis]
MNYNDFLKNKVIISEDFGFEASELSPKLHLHQPDIVRWSLAGGRRAIFASFGLGKSMMQLEIAKQCILKENKPFLIVCPLGVVQEFKRDNKKLGTKYDIEYITDTNDIENYENKIYITNYERVRKGDIDPSKFSGVTFDEASILRNLQTETTNYVLKYFKKVPFRFVATATPSPNDFIEILNYADYLGVADRGHLLTRFFKRDPKKAGNLQLLENKKDEFWKWVSTWAVFINTPSDLGYENKGYDLPPMNVIEHRLDLTSDEFSRNKFGDLVLFKDNTKSLLDTAKEKRDSISERIEKTLEILEANPGKNFILWHHLESERYYLEKAFKERGLNFKSVYGSQSNAEKEEILLDFSEGKFQYLITKPRIAGSGCNFQEYCNDMIFVGIDYKFNDFIQSIHRIYRFGQKLPVNIHVIYTNNEDEVFATLLKKWSKHKELQSEMIALVREYGLNSNLIKMQMERQIFNQGDRVEIGSAILYNNDCVIALDDVKSNSVGLIITSIPFGNLYEYSDNYNDFGHNDSNEKFFEQMDFLIPKLYDRLEDGRLCCIHVKDRVRYSYQNGTTFETTESFTSDTIDAFTGKSIKREIAFYQNEIQKFQECFRNAKTDDKKTFYKSIISEFEFKILDLEEKLSTRFHLISTVTILTDVVAENAQTYRLGWSENCKDATSLGKGTNEYVLIFRKITNTGNSYSPNRVIKTKENYSRGKWQIDASGLWLSDGNCLVTFEELEKLNNYDKIMAIWKQWQDEGLYNYEAHQKFLEMMDQKGKLESSKSTFPIKKETDTVWTNINRLRTLNANQVQKKKEKHVCPLQFDIVERLIFEFSNENDVVLDPFGGLMTVPYLALKNNRKAIGIELNSDYYKDGLFYVRSMVEKMNMPTLFDLLETETA